MQSYYLKVHFMKFLNQKWFCHHIVMILAAVLFDCYVIPATLAGILLVMVAPRLMADHYNLGFKGYEMTI